MTTKKQPAKQIIDGYVGLYAHNFNDSGRVKYQMKVIHQIPDGRLVCQLYSFLTGCETYQDTFTIEDTLDWKFYTTHEDWICGYEFLERQWTANQKKKDADNNKEKTAADMIEKAAEQSLRVYQDARSLIEGRKLTDERKGELAESIRLFEDISMRNRNDKAA